jgi:hypothetical protein
MLPDQTDSGDFERLHQSLHSLHQKVDAIMSTQAQADADTQAILQSLTDLATSSAAIQTELNTLADANPGIDLTALTAAVGQLDPAVQAVGKLVPAPAAPPPPPPPPAA